ncbi:MFS transporter [Paenibacillus mesophilus]|uniref:MFS transporter n=1 Tax=Paenibacillus mesophilus TaxID=2582849 RepID=UPI00110DDB15|nr:MFS transporter [Paenibacillus mesophilus]TMV42655.1 MFS transporter [Paenibacillus mesophilus]
MKATTRIYLDALLQNIKSVTFFTFLGVLIARLGASDFEIALSNSLPALFCALSLAFLTRQLPVTRGVFLTSGYVRQFAFICMALSVLLSNPIPVLLVFWSINAVSVIVTSAQQPAILRRVIEPHHFPALFSRNKIIALVITTSGGLLIGYALDATDSFFPYNYVGSMLIGCLSTFTGMSLIAGLAPREKTQIRLRWVRPFRECNRNIWWMALNNAGIYMTPSLFTIYHIKMLHLSNTQIGYFVVTAGIVSALALPLVRKLMERLGTMRIYSAALIGMMLCAFPYGFIDAYWLLVVAQAWTGFMLAVCEVSTQTMMMEEAGKHKAEMAYFSDFQLVMQLGMAIGPLIAGALVSVLPLWVCFCAVALLRLAFFLSRSLIPERNGKTAGSEAAHLSVR